jgi:hypothetical protein
MTVQELIESLQDLNPDAEVRFAAQPSWPFEYSIDYPVTAYFYDEEDEDSDEREVVYIAEGRQLGYLPKEAKDAIGW